MHRRSAHNSKSNRLYQSIYGLALLNQLEPSKWLNFIKAKPEIIVNGFKGAGIVDYLASD